jgi:UrcA family protein
MNVFGFRLIPAGALLSLALMQTAVSQADNAGEPLRTTVSYADLNLSSKAGAEAMYRRLQAAAVRVCPVSSFVALREVMEQKACVQQAIAGAVAQVNSPLLTRVHREKLGQSEATLLARKSW